MKRPTSTIDPTVTFDTAELLRWFAAGILVLGGGAVGVVAVLSMPSPSHTIVAETISSIEVVFESAEAVSDVIEPLLEPPAPEIVEPDVAPVSEPPPGTEITPEPEPELVPPVAEPVNEVDAIEAEQASEPQPKLVVVAMPVMRPADLTAPRPQQQAELEKPAQLSPAGANRPTASPQPVAQVASAPSAAQEASWQNRLLTHLNRKKSYPREAQRARQEGSVIMRFTIDSAGRLISSSIAQSSGFPALDEAAVALVQKASPYPAPPQRLSSEKMALRVPITYGLR
jgi:protein TonB